MSESSPQLHEVTQIVENLVNGFQLTHSFFWDEDNFSFMIAKRLLATTQELNAKTNDNNYPVSRTKMSQKVKSKDDGVLIAANPKRDHQVDRSFFDQNSPFRPSNMEW